jgi:hypothetical protein
VVIADSLILIPANFTDTAITESSLGGCGSAERAAEGALDTVITDQVITDKVVTDMVLADSRHGYTHH